MATQIPFITQRDNVQVSDYAGLFSKYIYQTEIDKLVYALLMY